MTAFFKNLEFGPRILLLVLFAMLFDFFLLGYVTRNLHWGNAALVAFLLVHAFAVGFAVFAGVRITTEHALTVIEEVRAAQRSSYDAAIAAMRRQSAPQETQPAMTPEDELVIASALLKRDAQQWREDQGRELSGLPHRLADADSEEAMPEPVSFVADEPDHEGPGEEEDGPWAEGYDERRNGTPEEEFVEEEIDPSTADGPFVPGTRQSGPMGERTW
jgi:hypothetical protein